MTDVISIDERRMLLSSARLTPDEQEVLRDPAAREDIFTRIRRRSWSATRIAEARTPDGKSAFLVHCCIILDHPYDRDERFSGDHSTFGRCYCGAAFHLNRWQRGTVSRGGVPNG